MGPHVAAEQGNVGSHILAIPMCGKRRYDLWIHNKISEGWVLFFILALPAATIIVLSYDPQFVCDRRILTYAAHVDDLCSALKNMSERPCSHRHEVHRRVAFAALSSELWHLLEFNKFPVWELPFSTWIIDRSNLIHKGGNLISWLFDERGLVSLGSAECSWWWGKTLKWMREQRQTTF